MEPTLSFAHLMLPAELFSDSFEQGVEVDVVLPDYLPDISRVIRCTLEPRALGRQWLGDGVELDGEVLLRMLYFSDESQNCAVYETTVPFSKSVDCRLSAQNVVVDLSARTDYCHCRVVNRRKAEIRGAASFALSVRGARETEALSGIAELGLQGHECSCTLAALQACISQQSEEEADFLLEGAEQELQTILDLRGICTVTDQRAADGQLFVRGNVQIQLLGQCSGGEICLIQRDLPFSRVLEEDSIADGLPAVVRAELLRLDGTLPEGGEEPPVFHVTAELFLSALQPAEQHLTLLDDCYSTEFETEAEEEIRPMPVLSELIAETGSVSDHLSWGDEHPQRIFGVFGALDRVKLTPKFGDLLLQGNLIYTVYYSREDGSAAVTERTVPFEIVRKLSTAEEDAAFDGGLTLSAVSVESEEEDGLEIRASMQLSGAVYAMTSCKLLTDVQVLQDAPKAQEKSPGLILYFGQRGEELWQIGKHYSLSVERILEENQLDGETLKEKQLLLIPTP